MWERKDRRNKGRFGVLASATGRMELSLIEKRQTGETPHNLC